MEKEFVDCLDLYGKVMNKNLTGSLKLHLLVLYNKIDRLKERLDVLEKNFKKSSD